QLVARWENRRAIVPIVASHLRNDNAEVAIVPIATSHFRNDNDEAAIVPIVASHLRLTGRAMATLIARSVAACRCVA
ncbi:MAG: hypothetical protein KDD69_19985, partial [Bdellovibrionales bacterium]|nr:hypothetical protein [Bdellovibrionales bacterium]